MLRRILLVFGLSVFASLSAQAQDKAELFGGFSYMRFHSSNLNGWEISGQYKFTDWLGGVADLDEHYGSINGIGTSTYTYLFGPQISHPSSVSPFMAEELDQDSSWQTNQVNAFQKLAVNYELS